MLTPEQLSGDLAKLGTIEAAVVAGGKMLPQLIGSAQSLFPEKGAGAMKIALVQSWVQGALATAGHDIPIIEAAWAKLEPVVATLVTIFTHNGIFASLLALTVPKAADAQPSA